MLIPIAAVVSATALAGSQVSGTPDGPFSLTVLGSPAGGEATIVNESGQAAGYIYVLPDYTTHAFFWSQESGMIDLGKADGTATSVATGLNDHGQVVGYGPGGPFSWTLDGGRVDLPTPGTTGGVATGVTNAGDIVGWIGSSWSDPDKRAVMWTSAGDVVELGTGPGSYPIAVNSLGHVVGANPYQRAFFWTPTDGVVNIGSLGGYSTYVYSLNNHDQVVGESVTSDGQWHAYLWNPTDGMVDLTALGGRAGGMNDAGQIVGGPPAFLWSQETGMVEFADPDWYSVATGVNASGAVIGEAYTEYGETHNFYWTPDAGIVELAGRPLSINDHGQIAGSVGDPAIWTLVPYAFSGFFPPVDNLGVFNVVNAGRSIPVKFDLATDRGTDIFAEGYPQSAATQCAAGLAQDLIEQTVSEDTSQLRYTPVGHYTYIWKTDPAWAGQCRQLQLRLNDGQLFTANFRFTR